MRSLDTLALPTLELPPYPELHLGPARYLFGYDPELIRGKTPILPSSIDVRRETTDGEVITAAITILSEVDIEADPLFVFKEATIVVIRDGEKEEITLTREYSRNGFRDTETDAEDTILSTTTVSTNKKGEQVIVNTYHGDEDTLRERVINVREGKLTSGGLTKVYSVRDSAGPPLTVVRDHEGRPLSIRQDATSYAATRRAQGVYSDRVTLSNDDRSVQRVLRRIVESHQLTGSGQQGQWAKDRVIAFAYHDTERASRVYVETRMGNHCQKREARRYAPGRGLLQGIVVRDYSNVNETQILTSQGQPQVTTVEFEY